MTTTLDITKDHCPMTFVKVKLALSRLNSGDLLEVMLNGEEPLKNIPKSAMELGHTIVSIDVRGNNHYILIKK